MTVEMLAHNTPITQAVRPMADRPQRQRSAGNPDPIPEHDETETANSSPMAPAREVCWPRIFPGL